MPSYGAYAQRGQRRGSPVEWEAGDVKRSRAAGVAQGWRAGDAGGGAHRKADATLNIRRFRANQVGREAGGVNRCGGDGGGGGGNPSPPVAGEKRRRVTASRLQSKALDEFSDAVRVARGEGVTKAAAVRGGALVVRHL